MFVASFYQNIASEGTNEVNLPRSLEGTITDSVDQRAYLRFIRRMIQNKRMWLTYLSPGPLAILKLESKKPFCKNELAFVNSDLRKLWTYDSSAGP